MAKSTLYIHKSPLQVQMIEILKKMASEPIDENVIHLAAELPEKYQHYLSRVFWLNPIGHYCLILPESFFKKSNKRFFNKAFRMYETLLKPILHIQIQVSELMKKEYNPETDGIRPLTYFSVIAETTKKSSLAFLITDPISKENFKTQIEALKLFLQKRDDYKEDIRRLHKVDGKTTFLLWNGQGQKWELVNLLFFVGKEKMLRYKKGLDGRSAKPLMMVNESNLTREMTLATNWSIKGNGRRYTMNRPNDIAIYQSIANKAIERAETRFKEINTKYITDLILNESVVSEFFDYFEEVIHGVIMSYTTIECMANSCIPYFHKHIVIEKGVTKIYDKESIEINFTLRDKLKDVIPPIIKSSSPVNEKWWDIFIQLETLRNEVIHTKSSKAETRYSMLIDKRIFKIAKIHNIIVSYYAKLLSEAKSYVMNDFPIGVGCDEVMPSLMTDKNFTKSWKRLHNIP